MPVNNSIDLTYIVNKIYNGVNEGRGYYNNMQIISLDNNIHQNLPKDKNDENYEVIDEILINHIDTFKRTALTMALEDAFAITDNIETICPIPEANPVMYYSLEKEVVNGYTKENIIYENQVVSNLSEARRKKENESIFSSISKLPFFMGGSGWGKHVIVMALWYNENIDTYQSAESCSKATGNRKLYSCPLLGNGKVGDDCSSFVFACLQYYGIIHKDNIIPRSYDFLGATYNKEFSEELENLGFYNLPYNEYELKPFDILALCDSNGHHVEIFGGWDSDGNAVSYGWGDNNSKKRGKSLPHKFFPKKYTSVWRTNDVYGGVIGSLVYNTEDSDVFSTSVYGTLEDYKGPFDNKIGSGAFQLGKGKILLPDNMYDLFHTFGYGTDRNTKYSGVECCKKIINTFLKYIDKGCNTLQNLFMMYHLGMSGTWEQCKQDMIRKGGFIDQGSRRWISAQQWILMQESYQRNGAAYMHMSLTTSPSKTRSFLYPLITFISRQEQGVNCEEAADIALKNMGIS